MPANLTDEDRAKNRRRSQEQDAFVPAQLQLKPSKKKKSSLRKSSKKKSTQSNKTSSTITEATTEAEWDDLGEELGTALQRSLGIAEGNNSNSNNDYSPSKNKKGDKQQKKNRNNNTTTPDDDNDLPPWKCPACTFKNEPLHLVCAICGTAAVALTKSVGSSSSGRASHLSASQLSAGGGGHLSASYMSTQNIPLNNTHRSYGSSDNLANSNGGEFRRSTLGEESLNRSHGNSNNNNNNTNGGGGAYNPQVDPHNHRRMNSGRRHSDDMSNDSEGYSYNIQEQVDFQDQRRKSRENDYYDRDLSHRSTRGGGGGDYRSRRRASLSGDGGRPRNLRRSQFEDDREARRGFSQSMQLDSSRGERIGGNGSVNSGHRHHRSRRRTDMMMIRTNNGGQYYDDGSIVSEMSDDEATFAERTVRTMQTIKKMVIPSGEVTIIYTDVQGSTALWEADPMSMKKATDIHDSIIRRCYSDHGGYEITTEGDAFNLAFQHPADAIGFALKAQLALYRAKWPEGTLGHPDGCDNEKKKFRGFRVRFGMHHGPTTSTVHKTTGRTTYQGEAVEVAKAIEKMSHGGQILTTVETWRTVSGMAEQLLGSPQVMDCEGIVKRIVQLVPNSLSYDFFAARGGQEVKEGEAPQKVCGRVFPPLLSHGQLSTSFLNAPYIGNKVAMVFVYTDKMEAIEDRERKKNFKILAKYVRSHLMRLSPPGYECQEDKGSWMLAFDRIDNGINFGLDLKENVMKNAKLLGDVDKSQVFRVGIHWGPFLSMGPHTVTGHADYFGPIVNRAARVAAQCEAGQICVGVPMGTDEEPPDPGPTVEVDVLGVKQLKGISIEMAIFGCRKKDKEEES
ncbi:nucleotidyl cyclase domain-containing protein [Skeletonema marinoi]|uniref:Nucleotidyl cyclase domain-containing protein n=1 Tax=Skeletonema marinoi TaxID=267567 RepID=A0AAD8Y8P2_9STRA|nr:nucleotidyl cyclase domain-containing protein [Skeletonema marinoi]